MIYTIDLHFQNLEQTIASFLIETSEGPILIETGPHSTFPRLKKEIEKIGFQVADIQHVFLTHIHFDHAGVAWKFAEIGAKIYLHPFGKNHLAHPEKLYESAKRIYQDNMDSLWGKLNPIPENQLITLEHNEKIIIGNTEIVAHHTTGHAVHHIAFQIEDSIFTGDVAGVRIDDGIIVPPCPPPDIDLEAWQNSISILRKLNPKKFYLTHFGLIENWEHQLSELEKMLLNWANWMKAKLEQNIEKEQIKADFITYTNQQYKDFGLSEKQIKQYEAANPAWMSVAGLTRYWKKKKCIEK